MILKKKLLSDLGFSKEQLKAEEKRLLADDPRLKRLYSTRLITGLLVLVLATYIFSKAFPDQSREVDYLVGFVGAVIATWSLTVWMTNPALLAAIAKSEMR